MMLSQRQKTGSLIRPLLILEINEIPWRVLDFYGKNNNLIHLNKFISNSQKIKTQVADKGHLSPWVTWPTIHRGINDELHGIRDVGQDPNTFKEKGSTIWEDYLENGHSVGVWGPFQSWPPINPGENGFFLPDTFAQDDQAFPVSLSNFQRLNLMLVRQNALVRSNRIGRLDFSMIRSLLFLVRKLSLRTQFSLFFQLIKERLNPKATNFRSVFQCLISWEVFKNYYMRRPPLAFANFFTNHVAGVLHRFWEDVFPEDVPNHLKRSDLGASKIYVDFAMKVLDQILGDVERYRCKYPELSVAFISSMGLAYHSHDNKNVDVIWEHPQKLIRILGIDDDKYKVNLAMHPQRSFQFNSLKVLHQFVEKLIQVNVQNGQEIFVASVSGDTVNVTTQIKANLDLDKIIVSGVVFNIFDFGFVYHQVDKLSSYHNTEGVFLLQEASIGMLDTNSVPFDFLKTDQIKSFLWNRFARV